MNQIIIVIFVVLLFGCCAIQKSSIFIPASHLTRAEMEEKKIQFKSDPEWSNYTFEEVFGDSSQIFTYRDEDIKSAFKTLTKQDKRLSLCSNSAMSNATLLVFESNADSPNRKWVKSSSCSPTEKGLICQPLELDIKYEYQSILFDAGVSLEYEEAVLIIEIVRKHGIEGLPRFEQRFSYKMINRVEKTANGYLIGFGELFCGHCVSSVVVKPIYDDDKNINKLKFVDAIGSLCI